jgi:bifunctional N-acetylglucosamine-1-phosphate-uridyltransferase/glucosamine-1-phosphate-acetyltransferase GlmU-like protein
MSWTAVVAALDESDAFRSRVSVYLHPLAGRPIVWHVVGMLAEATPRPAEVRVLHHDTESLELPTDLPVPVRAQEVRIGADLVALRAAVTSPGIKLLVDGAAPLVAPPTVVRLLRAAESCVVALPQGPMENGFLAVSGEGPALASADDPRHPSGALPVAATFRDELIRVTDRHSLAAAANALHDRIITRHESRGVSFVLPATTWVDAEVQIGADTVIYPGAVIEGNSEIGSECVIGPYSRIVNSTIGRGVELKGWNYIAQTSVRNHAVLEPYVRRGFG